MSESDELFGAVQVSRGALIDIGAPWDSVVRLVLPGVEFQPDAVGLRIVAKRMDWDIDLLSGPPKMGELWNLATQQVVSATPVVLRREDGRDAGADVGAHSLNGPANVALLYREPIGRSGAHLFRLTIDRSRTSIWA